MHEQEQGNILGLILILSSLKLLLEEKLHFTHNALRKIYGEFRKAVTL